MNYYAEGGGDRGHAGRLSRGEERGKGVGKAISTHLPCRPRGDRGIPGASFDWQRARLLRTTLFSRRSPSNGLPELFSRGRRRERAVVHVRILAIEAARWRKGHTSKKKKETFRVSNYNKSRCGDIAAIATCRCSEFTIGYVGDLNILINLVF